MDWKPIGVRTKGWLDNRWRNEIINDLKGLKLRNSIQVVKDRKACNDVVLKTNNACKVVVEKVEEEEEREEEEKKKMKKEQEGEKDEEKEETKEEEEKEKEDKEEKEKEDKEEKEEEEDQEEKEESLWINYAVSCLLNTFKHNIIY